MPSLFEHFEVNRTSFWPKFGRLAAVSLAVHSVTLATILYVPAFRDALNIAFLFSGADFVSRDYHRTLIGDDVEIVNLTTEKFRYPDGYFAPEAMQTAALPIDPVGATVVSQAGNQKPFKMPTPTPAPTPVPTPQASPAMAASSPTPGSSPATDSKAEKAANGKPKTPEDAQKELDKVAAANDVELPKEGEINKQVLKDFGNFANDLKIQGKLDLSQPFEIVIESTLDEHGKLKDPKFIKKAGDPNLIELSGRMIAALNDSGFLIYLKRINQDNPGTKVVFTVKLDQSEVVATVETEASSAGSARGLANVFNILLGAAAKSREGKDEEVLLKNTTVSPDGKRIKFNFTMPRKPMVDFITKQLAAS
ncbi:MAG: hypothetical protein QOD75_99 [Blastocatellia bacterium]|jgi:hypothetical protein|nr:hypothetical protein [Blastocatellia bacterium]